MKLWYFVRVGNNFIDILVGDVYGIFIYYLVIGWNNFFIILKWRTVYSIDNFNQILHFFRIDPNNRLDLKDKKIIFSGVYNFL